MGRESGWKLLRRRLKEVYLISADSFRPRDEWLVKELLAQVQQLVERLEALGGLTDEQYMALADLEALSEELDLAPTPARRALPWVLRVERWLLGHWEGIQDESVR
jgi:hypothetical protein